MVDPGVVVRRARDSATSGPAAVWRSAFRWPIEGRTPRRNKAVTSFTVAPAPGVPTVEVVPTYATAVRPETLTAERGAELDPLEVFQYALAGHRVRAINQSGIAHQLPVPQWMDAASNGDHRLFLDHCKGPTLDLGCGPGRLLVGLSRRSVAALGVDVSPYAVAHARSRGVRAICGDLFAPLPRPGRWRNALLADGNIGIGGDPARLLRRVAALLQPEGAALVEVAPPGTGLRSETLQLEIGGRLSGPFPWARAVTSRACPM